MDRLRQEHLPTTVSQVRWAIATGKVTRPPLDGSLRFNFSEAHLAELVGYFNRRIAAGGSPPRTGCPGGR